MTAIRLHSPSPESKGSTPFVSSSPTVAQVLDWHEANASRKVASNEAEVERRRIWRLLRAKLGHHLVAECKPFDLLAFINEQPDVKSDWTRKRWNGTVQRPFNVAEKLGLIVKNTFRGLTFPEGNDGRDWTDEEYRALLRAAKPLFRRVLVWIRFSGMRPGESRGLEFANIRLDDDKIVIEKHKMRYLTKKPRCIPLNTVLGKLLGWLARNNPQSCKHILLNSFGKPWSCKALTKTLAKLRRQIGLPDSVKLHGGRHTFATHAAMNGVDVASLGQMLGHRKIASTQRYTHVENKVDHLAGAMARAIVQPKRSKPPVRTVKADPPAPLFDGLE